jgi:hypothetical protein
MCTLSLASRRRVCRGLAQELDAAAAIVVVVVVVIFVVIVAAHAARAAVLLGALAAL